MLLFADDVILCIKNSKDSTKKLLDVISEFSKEQHEKLYARITNYQNKKVRKLHLQLHEKMKILEGNFNQGGKDPVLEQL